MTEYNEINNVEVVSNVPPFVDTAIQKILERFESDGYGAQFSHEELHQWLSVEMPLSGLREILKKEQLDYMNGMCKVSNALLDDYNLCLYSVPTYGYRILLPSEQIRKGADKHLRKAQRSLIQHSKVLTNIDISELTIQDRTLQADKQNRIAFIKAAFRKRKLPQLAKLKEIE